MGGGDGVSQSENIWAISASFFNVDFLSLSFWVI